jgi:hypothetical protein
MVTNGFGPPPMQRDKSVGAIHTCHLQKMPCRYTLVVTETALANS